MSARKPLKRASQVRHASSSKASPLAASRRDVAAELVEAKARIQDLEQENKELSERLRTLRKAKAGTTRVVKEPTKFDVIRAPSARVRREPEQLVLPPINNGGSGRMTELERVNSSLQSRVDALQTVQDENGRLKREAQAQQDQISKLKATNDDLVEEIDRLKLLLRIQQSEQTNAGALQKEVETLKGDNRRLQDELDKWKLLARETQREAEAKQKELQDASKAMQAVLLEGLRHKMQDDLLALRDNMGEMKKDYDDKVDALRLRWNQREASFRALWDEREQLWQDTIERWKKSAEVVITHKVVTKRTSVNSGGCEDDGDTSPQERTSVTTKSSHDIPPEILAKLGGNYDGWERKPSSKLGQFGGHGL